MGTSAVESYSCVTCKVKCRLDGEMKIFRLSLICIFLTTSAFGQLTDRNPVDELKDQVSEVLANAQVPLTSDQERQLALLIEEERQAAENLFGETWDFSQGPPQGEQRDQALAGIRWMYDELKTKLPTYMTDAQRAAWEIYDSDPGVASYIEDSQDPGADSRRVQQIRVSNNAFHVDTENPAGGGGLRGGGAKTEVIERGGVGAFHGNLAWTLQDESLNARNPFAPNKPPYYERTVNANISGPIIRDRLTLNFTVDDNKQENVGTVKAETPDGPFSLGVTRPTLRRFYDVKGVLQIADAHSLIMSSQYGTTDSRNENVGDFTLPERASRTQGQNTMIYLREVSILSEQTVHEVNFRWSKVHSETIPFSNAPAIAVKGAFDTGGAQNLKRLNRNIYELSNLVYFAGDTLKIRGGVQAWHMRQSIFSEEGFFGEFTFSDLASFRAGTPLQYRVRCCDPLFEMSQTQVALFSQNDFRLTNTFTLMLGARYQVQTNIRDRNNFDPRIGFAYAIGNATVVRGGTGIFTGWRIDRLIETFGRLDGGRRYEILIDNPVWSDDPAASGSIRPRSSRLLEPDLKAPYYLVSQLSVERSLPKNLFITLSYEIHRGIKLNRTRDINAPLPETGIRPFPDKGQIAQLQSSGVSLHRHFKATMRQRFSIFNVVADYLYYRGTNDQEVRSRGDDIGLPVNSYDLSLEQGDVSRARHRFNAGVNSRMPWDLYLTTTINATSGQYYTVTTGKDDNGDGAINDRPPGVPKNTEVGPHFFNVSFNFSKAFEFNRGGSNTVTSPQINVFANLNNAFNMTHPGIPSGVMTSPFFGRSFNASSPRTIEVGMRFQF